MFLIMPKKVYANISRVSSPTHINFSKKLWRIWRLELYTYRVVQKKVMMWSRGKVFLMESFSLYIHIFKKLCSTKSYGALKIPKIACPKLVKKLSNFLSFSKLTIVKIFDYKEIFFLYQFWSHKRFKNKHFSCQIGNFMTSIAFFNLDTWNFKTKQE